MALYELLACPMSDACRLFCIERSVLEHPQCAADGRTRQRQLERMQQHIQMFTDVGPRLRVAPRERVDRERAHVPLFGLQQQHGVLNMLNARARRATEQQPGEGIAQHELALAADRTPWNAPDD